MTSLLLLLIAIASFLFYGVVGQDKTWLLAPAFILSYTAITIALLKRAWRMAQGEIRPTSYVPLPTTALLWITFLLYGIAMIPQAAVPFEAKLVTLFIGGVVGAYLVWGTELTTFKDNRILLGALIFVVMLSALYGLIVHFKCPDWVLWAERYAVYEGRLMSTYICPNHFAHLMQMLMPFCVALLFIPQAGIYLKLLSAYSFLVFLPPLYLTESRAGWLGAITATGVVLCLMALRRSKKLFAFFVILVPLCSMLLLLGGWQYSETFQRRMQPVVEFLQQQNEEGVGSDAKDFRPQTWMDTIDMIKEAPLIGFGPGNYRYTFPEHRKRCRATRIVTGHPHNEYLELMADYGLVGFGLFALAWCFGLVRILIASLKAKETRHAFIGFAFIGAAAGTMVHSFFDFQMHVYPNALVFAFLAAVAIGPLRNARRGVRDKALGTRQEGVGTRGRGDAALESGGSTPLSVSHSARSAQNSGSVSHKEHKKTPNDDHSGQQGRNGIGHSALGHQGESELSAVSDGLLAVGDASYRPPPTSNILCPLWLRKAGAWLLAVGYLLGALFCLQIMGSSYIRVLGDEKSQALGTRHLALGTTSSRLSADRLYSLAVKIDPQNWRAYKGMGNLLFDQRYYSLEMGEKVRLAEQERSWYEKAYGHNPKDPEICMAYGKVLIFLGRSAISQQPLAISQEPSADSMQHAADSKPHNADPDILKPKTCDLTPAQHIEQGLELLREACRYRPFNDVYWWNLGIELRKAGRYEEALDAFHHSASIKGSPSTKMNIVWLNARIKALGEGRGEEDIPLKTIDAISKEAEDEEWTIPSPDNATANPELMDLLDKMGE